MNTLRLSSIAGAVLTAAVMCSVCHAEEAAPAPAPAPAPGAQPKAPPPALVCTNAMAERQALYQEMRELSLKLGPARARIDADPEIIAAREDVKKAQDRLNQLHEAKLRADPETAKLQDRMDAIRKEMSLKRPQRAPHPARPGAIKPMDRRPVVRPAATPPPAAPAQAPAAAPAPAPAAP